MTPQDLLDYNAHFPEADKDGDGFVSGDEVLTL
jgi:hypothetical protein